ncbi:MAG: putative 2OG-Fe(II) oxygenase [Rehaibacterium terrae]|uniref:putative 2OG-Fe(II) oxygenase n=1 Tax=Rehaibacterium terrae TaxID=1341696 RepID=UPI0039199035
MPTSAPYNLTANFATPLASRLHPSPDALNQRLRALFLEMEKRPAEYARPQPSMKINRGLFESHFHLFGIDEPAIRELRDYCWGTLFQLVCELNEYGPAEAAKLEIYGDSWFHITRQHGYFGMHNHPMASWSGVYCVDPGNSPAEHPDSGVLQFHHPNMAAVMYEDPGNTRLRAPFRFSNLNFHLRPGLLVLFPSWLVHEVLPYTGTAPRITVAFNCWMRMT